MTSPSRPNTSDRRLFLTACSEDFQILSFSQNPDASIYISSPDLANSKWIEIVPGDPRAFQVSDIPSAGKLSVHGSGVAHVRESVEGETKLRILGNYLKSKHDENLGVRHLVTIFLTKPTHIPKSAAGNRSADCIIKAEELKPYVLVFWAIPASRQLTVNISASFNSEDLETIPPESGFGSFGLRTHTIVWFAYRTKHMSLWPAKTHLCFHDGFYLPLLIGTGNGACRAELRTPNYHLAENQLQINV